MLDSLPESILIGSILPHLNSRDISSISQVTKFLNDIIPSQEDHYGKKYQIGKTLRRMLSFIKTGNAMIAKWNFIIGVKNSHSKKPTCLTLCKKDNTAFIMVNDQYITMTDTELMNWFDANIYANWNNIVLGTCCWYKSKKKKDEYRDITIKMTELLR